MHFAGNNDPCGGAVSMREDLIPPDPKTVLYYTDLGTISVSSAEELMCSATRLRSENHIPDMVFLLSHPKTVAVGLKDRSAMCPKDLLVGLDRLEEEGITFVRSIRGGGITYHWPGQVVCYPVIALEPGERNLPKFMSRLELVGIKTLERFGLEAGRRRDSPAHIGLWYGSKKIMSIGVRISSWVTSFGFAINVEGDYTKSCYVRPCGIEGAMLTTMEDALGWSPARCTVIEALKQGFREVFGKAPASNRDPGWDNIHRKMAPVFFVNGISGAKYTNCQAG